LQLKKAKKHIFFNERAFFINEKKEGPREQSLSPFIKQVFKIILLYKNNYEHLLIYYQDIQCLADALRFLQPL